MTTQGIKRLPKNPTEKAIKEHEEGIRERENELTVRAKELEVKRSEEKTAKLIAENDFLKDFYKTALKYGIEQEGFQHYIIEQHNIKPKEAELIADHFYQMGKEKVGV